MRNIRAVSIDLDDTLWPVEPVIAAAEQRLQQWMAKHCPRVARRYDIEGMRAERLRVAAERPDLQHDLTALRKLSLCRVLTECGYDESLTDAAFEEFMVARNSVRPYSDVVPALGLLAHRFPLASISNGNADLARVGLDRFFTVSVSAREVGRAKPDKQVFVAACRRLQCAPHEVLHIGDHPVQDVLGALDAGLMAVWINRTCQPWGHRHKAHAEVKNLNEVLDLLGIVAGTDETPTGDNDDGLLL